VRNGLGRISAFLNDYPSSKLDLIGVTGTNGKTTTSYLLESILRTARRSTGIIGTIEARYSTSRQPSIYTTPEAPELHRHLRQMYEENIDSVVMEVSSHGIDQHRIDATTFALSIFTNLSPEHLDYHGTIEQYYSVKAQLFTRERTELALICVDDTWGRRLASQIHVPSFTFGRHPSADLQIQSVSVTTKGTMLAVAGLGLDCTLETPIVGACNAENAAAAYLAGRLLGATLDQARSGVAECEAISGRFQRIDTTEDLLVVVDYAHTPDSIRALVTTARDIVGPNHRVILVAGARGRRDRFKRPELGRAAATADLAVLTTDNPGDEDPQSIVDQLIAGTIDIQQKNFIVELDRASAIRRAILAADEGDAVLIVGRGHESSLRVGATTINLDDREEALHVLQARKRELGRAPKSPTPQIAGGGTLR
jgi:UDP-N-acetylmuramoyl-L-alanyl-D-glutamate--2,6-diaminopimelate ligase